jgi:membrane protease subunit (stomatin/prohibitin family)
MSLTLPDNSDPESELSSIESKATGFMGIVMSIVGLFSMFRAVKTQKQMQGGGAGAAPAAFTAEQNQAVGIAKLALQTVHPDMANATVLSAAPIPDQPQTYQITFKTQNPGQSLWAIVNVGQNAVTQSNFQ